MKYTVQLLRTVVLSEVEVEADNSFDAENKAMGIFYKVDLDNYDDVKVEISEEEYEDEE